MRLRETERRNNRIVQRGQVRWEQKNAFGFSNMEVINELDKRSFSDRTDVESKWNRFMREEEKRNWKQKR